jgi:uncharacterized protein
MAPPLSPNSAVFSIRANLGDVRQRLQRFAHRARELWQRAWNEHCTPREVGWSVALGVFVGCTPLLGLHMWIALALATLFRVNRVWAFLGSRVSSNVVFAWIAFAEIELAHRLRLGAWAPLLPREALVHGRQLLLDWFLGSAFVGAALAGALGALAYAATRRRQRAGGLTQHTPDEPRRPISESPPSTPRVQTR